MWMYISSSVVPESNGFNSVRVYCSFPGLKKIREWLFLCVRSYDEGGCSAAPMARGTRCQVIIYYLSTGNNRVYSGRKMNHQMSRLHKTLNTERNDHDDDCACAPVKTLNILSLNFLPVLDTSKDSNFCTASSIWGPACPSKMLPSNEKNSSTI
jgi:hypothetical protein